MALTCNIDARGKRYRLVYGIICVLIGLVLVIEWARPTGSIVAHVVSWLFVAGGAFAIFEARAGWCAIRAMGFNTRV